MNEEVDRNDYERPLADAMARFAGRDVLFVEPGGNWGDSLIYLGAETLANRLGIRWQRLSREAFLARTPDATSAIYVHGGGGFNFFCSGKAPEVFLHALHHYRGPVLLGPTTVDDEQDYVEKRLLPGLREVAASEVTMFVRELTSLRALAGRLPAGVRLNLDHDSALQLTADEALQGRTFRGRYTLLALRKDDEAPAGMTGAQFDGVRLDPAMYGRSFDHWLRIHALASRIITNRTHSTILSAVLGKPTTMLGGSYHKNRSIWEYSLNSRGVAWLDWSADPASTAAMTNGWSGLPVVGRLARSWKVQRMIKRMHGVPLS